MHLKVLDWAFRAQEGGTGGHNQGNETHEEEPFQNKTGQNHNTDEQHPGIMQVCSWYTGCLLLQLFIRVASVNIQ